MRREEFLLESALFNHEFEVNVNVLSSFQVNVLLLFLLSLSFLHLKASLLSVLFYFFDFVKVSSLLLYNFLTSLHI